MNQNEFRCSGCNEMNHGVKCFVLWESGVDTTVAICSVCVYLMATAELTEVIQLVAIKEKEKMQ